MGGGAVSGGGEGLQGVEGRGSEAEEGGAAWGASVGVGLGGCGESDGGEVGTVQVEGRGAGGVLGAIERAGGL